MTAFSMACLFLTPVNLILAVWVFRLAPREVLNRIISASFMVTGVWTWAAAVANTAVDDSVFWFALRVGMSCYLVLTPLSVAILLVFVRARRRWLVILVGLSSAVAATMLFRNWTGPFIYSGFHSTPWGNAVDIGDDSFWGATDALIDGVLWLTTLGFLARAWATSRSRRYRSLAAFYLGFHVTMKLLATFALIVVSREWGFPEPSVLFTAPLAVFYFYLIGRYQHLTTERPDLEAPLFESMQDLILFTNSSGIIIKAGTKVAALLPALEGGLVRQPLSSVLSGWTGLQGQIDAVVNDHQPVFGIEGTLGNGKFLLDLTPVHDKFRDIDGVLVRLRPSHVVDQNLVRFGVSPREREVAVLVGEGLTTQEIGEALFISPATVKNHLYNLYQKTGAKNRVELGRILRPEA